MLTKRIFFLNIQIWNFEEFRIILFQEFQFKIMVTEVNFSVGTSRTIILTIQYIHINFGVWGKTFSFFFSDKIKAYIHLPCEFLEVNSELLTFVYQYVKTTFLNLTQFNIANNLIDFCEVDFSFVIMIIYFMSSENS